MSEKYSQRLLDYAKQSAIDAPGDFIGNKIANRITKVSKNSSQKHSETVTKKYLKKERYISPEERQKIIDHLILI